ncbi:MAG TPA: DUF2807 domain-containing protein [Mucilaginibacter sp.]
MKTSIVTFLAVLSLAFGISNNANAATVKNADDTYTVLTDITAINKIEVYGNVQLFVSDGPADQVKVYNKYYSENAVVQSKNGVLKISSYKADKLVVWVTANDLRGISAYDKAEVKSFGDLSKIEFDVDLHDNATAKLNMDVFNANVIVADNAKICLNGKVNDFSLKCDRDENVDNKNFLAEHSTKKPVREFVANKADNIADL